jgi:hypothetical protein
MWPTCFHFCNASLSNQCIFQHISGLKPTSFLHLTLDPHTSHVFKFISAYLIPFQVKKKKDFCTTFVQPFFIFYFYFYFYDQSLDLFSYMWVLNIQWLILKKIVRIAQKLYGICARNITKKKKTKDEKNACSLFTTGTTSFIIQHHGRFLDTWGFFVCTINVMVFWNFIELVSLKRAWLRYIFKRTIKI